MVIRNTSPNTHFLPHHRPTVISRLEEVRAMKIASKLHIVEIVTESSFQDKQQNFDEIDPSENAFYLSMSDEKIGLISEYHFEEFCEHYFRTVFSWGTKVPIEEIMKFSSSMIDTSLVKISKHLRETAKNLFKCILTYMGERPSSKPSAHYVIKALRIVLSGNSDLADEFYCQIIKQTNTDSISSALKAWTFCGIVSGIVAPSSRLRLYLLSHMMIVIKNESQEIAQRATYSASRLEEIYSNGTRLVLPSETEIMHLEAMKPLPISVYFKNGSCITMLVESYSNANAVKRKLLKQLNITIPKMVYFGLYEFVQGEGYFEERYIEEQELIMDIITEGEGSNKIVLQYRVYPQLFSSEPETVSFYYLQLAFDVVAGKIPINVDKAIQLAGLMLQVDRGNFTDAASLEAIQLEDYIPLNLYKLPGINWRKLVFKSYKHLVGIEVREAKQQYIEALQANLFFATTSFSVQFMKVTGGHRLVLPSELILGVSSRGVDVHTASMSKHIMHFEYNRIVSWGVSKNLLMLSALHDHCQISIYLSTNQARLIHSLADAYALVSVSRSLKQISESSCTRKEGLSREQASRYLGKAARLSNN